MHRLILSHGDASTLIAKSPNQFKKQITEINPELVLLQNDSTSPRGQWVIKNYRSCLISELTVNTRQRYVARKNAGFIGSRFLKLVHRLAGFTAILYKVHIDIHDPSLKTLIRLLRDKLCFSYEPKSALPGWYCNYVIVQNEDIRQLYIENAFDENKILNIGTPYEDYYKFLSQQRPIGDEDIDVLLFSQPFYLRGSQIGWTRWLILWMTAIKMDLS